MATPHAAGHSDPGHHRAAILVTARYAPVDRSVHLQGGITPAPMNNPEPRLLPAARDGGQELGGEQGESAANLVGGAGQRGPRGAYLGTGHQ
ncbi:hypothetical protein GCM10027614_34010 [Micromonospora vulcania]